MPASFRKSLRSMRAFMRLLRGSDAIVHTLQDERRRENIPARSAIAELHDLGNKSAALPVVIARLPALATMPPPSKEISRMTISMYQASAPVFIKMLGNLKAILQKAEAHAQAKKIDESAFLGARLYPDMLP